MKVWIFFINFDFNKFQNKFEDNNEKLCSWFRNRVSHKIDFKAVWPSNGHAASVGVKVCDFLRLTSNRNSSRSEHNIFEVAFDRCRIFANFATRCYRMTSFTYPNHKLFHSTFLWFILKLNALSHVFKWTTSRFFGKII